MSNKKALVTGILTIAVAAGIKTDGDYIKLQMQLAEVNRLLN